MYYPYYHPLFLEQKSRKASFLSSPTHLSAECIEISISLLSLTQPHSNTEMACQHLNILWCNLITVTLINMMHDMHQFHYFHKNARFSPWAPVLMKLKSQFAVFTQTVLNPKIVYRIPEPFSIKWYQCHFDQWWL